MPDNPNAKPRESFRAALKQAKLEANTEDQRRSVQGLIDRFFGVTTDSGNNGPAPPPPGDGG